MALPSLRRPRLAAIGWSLLVAVLLLAPGDEIPDAGAWKWLDKPVHALLFGAHCALLDRAAGGSERARRWPAGAMALSALYALLLEALQIRVPGRAWDGWDLVAGVAGIALAALVIGHRRARLPRTLRGS